MVDAEGWQQTRARAAPPRVQVETPLETTNPYEALGSLPDETVLREDHPETRAMLSPPPKKATPKKVVKKSATEEPPASGPGPSERRKVPVSPAPPPCSDLTMEVKKPIEFEAKQIFDRPHQASYFIPGRVEGRPAQFLLDTGCTTNLLAKHLFDRLPESIRSQS